MTLVNIFVGLDRTIDVGVLDDQGRYSSSKLLLDDLSTQTIQAFEDGLVWLSGILETSDQFKQTQVVKGPGLWDSTSETSRASYDFHVTIAGAGEKTVTINTEQMPPELRDLVLSAVEEISQRV